MYALNIDHCPQVRWLVFTIMLLTVMPRQVAALPEEIKIGGTGGALGTMRMLAEAYQKDHPETKVTVLPSLGSSGGIKAVLAGAIQIAVSARALKPAETRLGAIAFAYGRTPFVFTVAPKVKIDAITIKEVEEIYSGQRTHWPDGTKIRIVLRPVGESDSEMVKSISPEVNKAKILAEQRPGMQFSITDQENADNLEKIPGAFGPTTLAQIITEKRHLKPLRFNGVEPSAETLANGRYPYFKQLFIVTGPKISEPVQQFIEFVHSPAARELLARTGHALE